MGSLQQSEWIDYRDRKPDREGFFMWRVPHIRNGHVLQFPAKMRERGAGFESVLSFQGDHWDGYRVTVPAQLQWRELLKTDPNLAIEGLSADPCPFCGGKPTIKTSDGWICSLPFQDNKVSIECCFASVKYREDWNEAFVLWNTRTK